ncbi:hypothetical protein H4R23_006009 [Coemansia sp. Cherry 401B]|nr:hypothetical protein IWW54_000865 [Coemansia sp. RSA 2705]KAJ2369258.1 hypothetical protein H4S01_001108 [Coemansia sp. RSA 2610]KAJ2713203.1 hypothetical protein H4R23_006009 [Coemansia sp. Cherry 401B]
MDTEHREPTLHASDASDDETNTALAAANSAPATEDTGLRLRRRAADSSDHSDDEQAVTTARADKGKGPASESNDNGTLPERPPEASDEFSCNICFDTASEPVLTICGHLFCWSCLVQWLERSATCPVCKAGCDKEKVIPVYGRGKEEKDPRSNPSIPNRPQGRRPPPPLPRQPNQFFGFDPFGVPGSFHGVGMGRGGGAVFVGGFGFLPALMGLSAFAGAQAGNAQPAGQPAGRQAFASRILMMLAAMILMSIVFY